MLQLLYTVVCTGRVGQHEQPRDETTSIHNPCGVTSPAAGRWRWDGSITRTKSKSDPAHQSPLHGSSTCSPRSLGCGHGQMLLQALVACFPPFGSSKIPECSKDSPLAAMDGMQERQATGLSPQTVPSSARRRGKQKLSSVICSTQNGCAKCKTLTICSSKRRARSPPIAAAGTCGRGPPQTGVECISARGFPPRMLLPDPSLVP